jgi:hypothetical protein
MIFRLKSQFSIEGTMINHTTDIIMTSKSRKLVHVLEKEKYKTGCCRLAYRCFSLIYVAIAWCSFVVVGIAGA